MFYLASEDEAKANCAESLLQGGGTTSVQVLNEIANVARRKMGMTWAETHGFLSPIRELLELVPLTELVHELGLRLAELHQLSIYDGTIVAAALDAGCDTLLSEDMHSGLVVGRRLKIVDPLSGL
jgi:predicted nucleic acid-binding protein